MHMFIVIVISLVVGAVGGGVAVWFWGAKAREIAAAVQSGAHNIGSAIKK